MDFTFINELMKSLEANNIFRYTFTGSKILAFGLLAFRILETFIRDFDSKEPKIGNVMTIMGYGLIIMSSDWIIGNIEDIFATVDTTMGNTESDLYNQLNEKINQEFTLMFEMNEDWWEIIGDFIIMIESVAVYLVAMILGGLFKIADLSLTASYLVQRIFILKLLQFLFPLTIALSTYRGTEKLFHTWILRYIGVFILGIAYIGIINIMPIIQNSLMNQWSTYSSWNVNGGEAVTEHYNDLFAIGILVTVIVVFTIKVKLFSVVTNYVMSMFQ